MVKPNRCPKEDVIEMAVAVQVQRENVSMLMRSA
jgi:hypothetical protein